MTLRLALDAEQPELLRCTCGREPTLRVAFSYVASSESLYHVWYECSRWIFKCHRAPRVTNSHDWYDLALRRARTTWNEMIARIA